MSYYSFITLISIYFRFILLIFRIYLIFTSGYLIVK